MQLSANLAIRRALKRQLAQYGIRPPARRPALGPALHRTAGPYIRVTSFL